jgi:hypothetical protein
MEKILLPDNEKSLIQIAKSKLQQVYPLAEKYVIDAEVILPTLGGHALSCTPSRYASPWHSGIPDIQVSNLIFLKLLNVTICHIEPCIMR